MSSLTGEYVVKFITLVIPKSELLLPNCPMFGPSKYRIKNFSLNCEGVKIPNVRFHFIITSL